MRLRLRARARSAERVAAEAALDDPVFAPERVRESVAEILAQAGSVWRGTEGDGFQHRRDCQLIGSWARGLEQIAGSGLRLARDPSVWIIGVVNRETEAEDRVVVRVGIVLRRDPHARTMEGDGTVLATRTVELEQRWTLTRHADNWYLVSVDGDPLTGSALSLPLISSPVADENRIRELALREMSRDDTTPDPGALIDRDEVGASQLLDLSVADGRFSPTLIEATLRHLIEAWETASGGSERPLRELASRRGAESLLHPGGRRMRRVIQDASLERWEVVEIDADHKPSTLVIGLVIDGKWRDETLGRRAARTDEFSGIHLSWRLELFQGTDHGPQWRLASSGPHFNSLANRHR